ncbi:MAG: hypothetical protein IIA58_06450 [Candidatus Marinimicrobia bacterium]|nr:hypothetical protein [Candidatus Neomarinimicrobiota bacterium]
MAKVNLDKPVLKAEIEIDRYHLTHPFIKLKKTEAFWYLFCAAEESMMMTTMNFPDDLYIAGNYVDSMKYVLKYCMQWINHSCTTGGKIPLKSNPKLKTLAIEFLNIGSEYQVFVVQYTLALKGILKMKAENYSLDVDYPPNYDRRIEAYNQLLFPELIDDAKDITTSISDFRTAITSNIRMGDGTFTYSIKPRDVIKAINYIKEYSVQAYELPPEWKFARYSLSEFKKVYDGLTALAHYHLLAYNYSIGNARPYGGFITNIYKFKMAGMINRLSRYTAEINKETIKYILNDLTYGSHDLINPDPALQPIIPLSGEQFAIIPSILISNSPERNLISLLNRIPKERHIYSKISNEKESIMRDKIKSELNDIDYRFWNGKISKTGELPDIDLAIISESEKIVLICELKWFLDPAETREMIEKTDEIVKGIEQIEKLRKNYDSVKDTIDQKLNITSDYDYMFIVISENFIGLSSVHVEEIPVINRSHIIHKIKEKRSLKFIIEWLKQRNYLPTPDIHFKTGINHYKVGKWSIPIISYKPLIKKSLKYHT